MADITCPVCGTVNPASRTFCLKCAADLHAMAPDPAAPPPPPKVVVPVQPLLIGSGVALAAIALIALLVVALGGGPGATATPGGAATPAPSVAASADAGGSGGPPTFVAPTAVAPTAVAPTQPPPTAAPPATPRITPVPAPTILSFTGPETVDCSQPGYDGFITLTWTVDNADSTTLSIDGSGLYKSYPGTQGGDSVPFSCGNGFHTYTLWTVGGSGKPASKTLTIQEIAGT